MLPIAVYGVRVQKLRSQFGGVEARSRPSPRKRLQSSRVLDGLLEQLFHRCGFKQRSSAHRCGRLDDGGEKNDFESVLFACRALQFAEACEFGDIYKQNLLVKKNQQNRNV